MSDIDRAAELAVSRALASFVAEIKQAADEGVTEALERVGIAADDPIEVQRDMAFLRDWRKGASAIGRKGALTAVGIVAAGVLGVLWLGIKALFS
jgi:hypothetical protein